MGKVLVVSLTGLGCMAGIVLSAVRLPGVWLIVCGAALLGWLTHWRAIGPGLLLWIAGIALLAEFLEFLMSVVLAKKAGGSRRAAIGALIGGFAGMVFLAVPLPIIGSIMGALVGCFIGAAIGELSIRGSLTKGTKVGVFAAVGMALGTATKVALTFVVSIIVVASTIQSSWPTPVEAQHHPPAQGSADK